MLSHTWIKVYANLQMLMHLRHVPDLWGMCWFSGSIWPSDPRLTWLTFHTHTHSMLRQQHTHTQLHLSPDVEPTPLNAKATPKSPHSPEISKPKIDRSKLQFKSFLRLLTPVWGSLASSTCSVGAVVVPQQLCDAVLSGLPSWGPDVAAMSCRAGRQKIRGLVGLLLGFGSVPQWFNSMLRSVGSELWQSLSCLMPHFPNTAQSGWFISTRCYSVLAALGWQEACGHFIRANEQGLQCVHVCLEMRDRRLVFLKYSSTHCSCHNIQTRLREEEEELINTLWTSFSSPKISLVCFLSFPLPK